MPASFTGGCACGSVRYTCPAKPVYMGNCHCRDCQRATGSAYIPGVIVSVSAFSVSGQVTWFEKKADRGPTMRRGYCRFCGSPLILMNEATPHLRILYAGSLDDPSWFVPEKDIYTASAQPWDLMDPRLPKARGMHDYLEDGEIF